MKGCWRCSGRGTVQTIENGGGIVTCPDCQGTGKVPLGFGPPVFDAYYIKAIEHARERLIKEPCCAECTTTIEAFDKLITAAGGPRTYEEHRSGIA